MSKLSSEFQPMSLSELLKRGDMRGDLTAQECPSREVLKHITSKWGVLILMSLQIETLRFSALRRKLAGVSERMLSQTLQTLEEDGFVNRVSFNVVPPHVEYSLTPFGQEAAVQVAVLADWVEINMIRVARNWSARGVDRMPTH